jgi:HlyD family secretion protein
MRNPLAANATQARQTKQVFARPEDQLSYELGKAVQELPPLYTRVLAGALSAVVVSAIAWAHFSQIDEVATAPGELIASTQVRPVTSIGNGSIVAVRVQQLDVTRLSQSAKLIKEDISRLNAERTGNKDAGSQMQDELLSARLKDFEARQAAAEAEAKRQTALIDQAKVRLARLQENLTNARTSQENSKANYENSLLLRTKVCANWWKVVLFLVSIIWKLKIVSIAPKLN